MTYEEFALATAVSSTDTDVATVAISDDTVGKIVVTAVAPTTATINVTVTIDGETTALTASVTVEPRSGIYIDDETPIDKYKGTYSALYIKGLPDGMTQAEFASTVTLTCSDENVTATTGENYGLGLVVLNIGANAGSSFTLTVDLDGDVLVVPYTTSVHANAITAEHGSTPIDPTSPITTAVNDTFRIYLDGLDGTETGARISGLSGEATVSLVATQDGEGYLEVSTPTTTSDGASLPIIIDSPRGSYTVVLLNETIMQVVKEPASINVIDRYYGMVAGSGATVRSTTATYGSIKALSSIQSPLTASVVDSSQVDCTSKFTIVADPSVSTGGFSIAQKTGADAPTAGEYTLTLTAGVGQTVQFAVSVPSEPTGPTFRVNCPEASKVIPGINTNDCAYMYVDNIVNKSGGTDLYTLKIKSAVSSYSVTKVTFHAFNGSEYVQVGDGVNFGQPITIDASAAEPLKIYIHTSDFNNANYRFEVELTDSNGYSTTFNARNVLDFPCLNKPYLSVSNIVNGTSSTNFSATIKDANYNTKTSISLLLSYRGLATGPNSYVGNWELDGNDWSNNNGDVYLPLHTTSAGSSLVGLCSQAGAYYDAKTYNVTLVGKYQATFASGVTKTYDFGTINTWGNFTYTQT